MIDQYKKLVRELISLQSVSADPSKKEDCLKTAEWLSAFLKNAGFKSQIFEGYGNPIVLASIEIDPSFETCLIYGHYDVQPAEKEDGWDNDPFEVTEKNGKLFGRGIMDDKGQFFVHLITISNLIKEKKLKYNIKFIFEGNEETGSPFIEKFIQDNKDILTCDFILISDGEMTRGKPTIELGNRGILNWKLTVKTSNSDIHSGLYGGAAPNAIAELVKKHVKKHMPHYVEYDLSFDEFAGPSKTDKNSKYVQMAVKVLEEVFKSSVHYRYVGGTEPVILYFQQILGNPIVSVPFANEDGFMHGVNENFNIENIEKMMEFGKIFFTVG